VIAAALLALSALGLVLAAVQALSLRRHLRQPRSAPGVQPFISVLKPLCGVDDDLWRNLRSFACLDYPRYEVLLGVKDQRDSAYPIALAAAERWPWLMRVVVQRGAPGLNPKVNQLITLSAEARGELLLVSDSNIRVRRGYLRGTAAAFEDPQVALVTHPVAGAGERSLGALLDNLQMCGAIAPGIIAAKRVAGKDVVVGKSMALRRTDLRALGGFERLKDVLAEDFLSGRMVARELGKKVALAREPVLNVTRDPTVSAFFSRYLRWSVMQRKAVGNLAYASQILLNPVALAGIALAAFPSPSTALAFAGAALGRAALHEVSARSLRGRGFALRCLAAPAGDLLVAAAWSMGFFKREICWRGNRFAVLAGTRLQLVEIRGHDTQLMPTLDSAR
jgi:ceramide glucosyltransferase